MDINMPRIDLLLRLHHGRLDFQQRAEGRELAVLVVQQDAPPIIHVVEGALEVPRAVGVLTSHIGAVAELPLGFVVTRRAHYGVVVDRGEEVHAVDVEAVLLGDGVAHFGLFWREVDEG